MSELRIPASDREANILGRRLQDEGRFEDAAQLFEAVLVRSPESTVARVHLGQVRQWLNVRHEVANFAAEKGVAALRRAINNAKEADERSQFRFEGRRYLLAREGTAWDWCGFGRELGQGGEHHLALAAYRTAIAMDGSPQMRWTAFVGVAPVLRRMGSYQKAAELLAEVLTADPNNTYAHAASRKLLQEAEASNGEGLEPAWFRRLAELSPRWKQSDSESE